METFVLLLMVSGLVATGLLMLMFWLALLYFSYAGVMLALSALGFKV